MGWSIGWDSTWNRDIGYGVPAYCDHPKCSAQINRGLAYVCCDQAPYGGDKGCGLYFCGDHHDYRGRCPKCRRYDNRPYRPKPEHPKWIRHVLRDKSWAPWRNAHPEDVARLRQQLPQRERQMSDTAGQCPYCGKTEAEIRESEREAVLNVVRRHIHSGHFLRVQAKVNADAEERSKIAAPRSSPN